MKNSLVGAIFGGAIAALIGAILWAVMTVWTGYQIGYAAIGVGALVGVVVRVLGKGETPLFGIIGGTFALLGCALGNFLSAVGFATDGLVAEGIEVGYFDVLSGMTMQGAVELMKVTFSPMDILFYAVAAYAGFQFSFDANPTVEATDDPASSEAA
ncbi:MAG: hypothetical protein SGJ20_11670 [Planctomycetota bacterium]|nr:hypothetical protein [Planctomycetota bacterium]